MSQTEFAPVPRSPAAGAQPAVVEVRPDVGFGRLPWTAFVIIVVLVVVAVFAPVIAPHSATEQSLPDKLRPPAWQEGGSATHLLGTDLLEIGRAHV